MVDDLWLPQDGCNASTLAFFELSTAFDFIDYGILLDQLRTMRVEGPVVVLLFLPCRAPVDVCWGDKSSPCCRVLQRSTFSVLFFNRYIKSLERPSASIEYNIISRLMILNCTTSAPHYPDKGPMSGGCKDLNQGCKAQFF